MSKIDKQLNSGVKRDLGASIGFQPPPEGSADVAEARCAEMVMLLDRQLADLEGVRSQLEELRAYWMAALEAKRRGEPVPRIRKRAARGTLRDAVKEVVFASEQGVTLAQIDTELSARISQYNRHSISEALKRLRDAGMIVHDGALWRRVC